MDDGSVDDFWLFGYGLIWKPPPHFGIFTFSYDGPCLPDTQMNEFQATYRDINGDSGSEDHRGTPEAPGRVVTLIDRSFWLTLNDVHQEDADYVWGVAYHIKPCRVKEVREYLDIREVNGYSIQHTPFRPADSRKPDIRCLVYIGMPDNPQFLGALNPQDVAQKINESVGPSGENREYLLNLEAALLDLSPNSKDDHITDLARRVRLLVPPQREATVRDSSASSSHAKNFGRC